MTLAIACPTCRAQPGDGCWGADGRWTPQHEARLAAGEERMVLSEPLTNYVEDVAKVEAMRGDWSRPEMTVHPQHPPRHNASVDDLQDYDDVMRRPR